METRFENNPPMRAALAYYLQNPQPSVTGIEHGHPNAIRWPSGGGGGCIELPEPFASQDKVWLTVLALHDSILGIYKVTCHQEEMKGEKKEIWLVHEFDDHWEIGDQVDPESVENFSSSGLS